MLLKSAVILALMNFFGSSLRLRGISFYSLAPILEKNYAFFVMQHLRLLRDINVTPQASRRYL